MTRRLVQITLVVVGFVGALLLRPAAAEAPLDLGVEQAPPAYLGCFGRVEQSLASTIHVGSVIRGGVLATLVASGSDSALDAAIDPAGGVVVDFAGLGAAGVSGALVELPTSDAAAATVLSRDQASAVAACTPASTELLLVAGGSTATGETLDLVLVNPYAADAVVSIGSSSESGEDSATEIASVLVPARATVVRQLESLLSLRQSLSVRMEVQRGAIHAALLQESGGDVAISEAVAPAQDWWLPSLLVRDATSRLVVSTASPLPADIQIDVSSAGTVTEAVYSGTVEARSQLDIPVADLGEGPLGLRVSADGPIVATLVVDGEGTRAITPGTTLSTEWIVPGSGAYTEARLWVFNPGEVEAEMTLQPLAPGLAARAATVPADSAIGVPIEQAGAGYLVRSTSEVAVFWSVRVGGLALGTGHPLSVLTE